MTQNEIDELTMILKFKKVNYDTKLDNHTIAKQVVRNETLDIAIQTLKDYNKGRWGQDVLRAFREQAILERENG